MVVFATQNVIKEPPFTRLDLLCCRNVMIYLEPQMQELLIPVFHYALLPGGVLFVSPSEGIGNHADLFSPIDRKWKFYRATSVHKLAPKMTVNRRLLEHAHHSQTSDDTMKKIETINFPELTKRVLLQTFAPASVVTDVQGNILYVHGDTGKYLRPAPGAPSLNVIDMAREGLQLDLRTAMNTAVTDGLATVKRQVPLRTETDFVQISLSVRVLPKPETDTEQRFLLISFEDIDPPVKAATEETESGVRSPLDGRIEDLERHLSHTKANLQATIEEQQATNEELKSTNEEMQSTNEELQSTNEELETSREELQSVNEELITVNTELQTKIGQLSDMQNDMKNLMDNMNVGTIFLDSHLAIRRFTREATRVYRLAQTDVDRSLGDIKSRLAGGDLLHEAQNVLDTLKGYEAQVQTMDGDIYLARIQPYRTLENMIAGVVLTFTDITEHVQTQQAMQSARTLAEAVVDTVREPLLVLGPELVVVSASQAFYRFFQVRPQETLGRPIYQLGNGQWDIPALREILEKLLPQHKTLEDYKVVLEFPSIGSRSMQLNARRIVDPDENLQLILLAMTPDKTA